MQPRIIFMGTPDFAVPALRALAERAAPSDLLVVTQPDRPTGRGRGMQPPRVKDEAERLSLDVRQIETFRDAAIRAELTAFAPDLVVVAAFGRILPRWVLSLPDRGCVNVHASLLPRFRGASPVAAAIACGDRQAGVALMEMEAGLDTGGVYASINIDITSRDTTETLTERLARAGGELVSEYLDPLLAGDIEPIPQRGEMIETRKILKAHGAIDWARPADEIERHVRAMWPWPRAWAIAANGTRVQIHAAEVVSGGEGEPGVVLGHDEDGVLVGAGADALRLTAVQLPGKAAQPAGQLARHPVFTVGARLDRGQGFELPEPWIVGTGEA